MPLLLTAWILVNIYNIGIITKYGLRMLTCTAAAADTGKFYTSFSACGRRFACPQSCEAQGVGGTLKWKFQTGNRIYSSPVIGRDGTVFIGSDDGSLYAINPTGYLKWRFRAGTIEKELRFVTSSLQSTLPFGVMVPYLWGATISISMLFSQLAL